MTDPKSIRVLSIDSNESSRLAVRQALQGSGSIEIAAEVTTAAEALQWLGKEELDVVLIDLRLPDGNGVELTKKVRDLSPNVRVVILTSSDVPEDIFAAMDAGADGYVLKGNISTAIETAIRSVRLSAVWLDPGIAQQVLKVIEAPITKPARILPTGLMAIPLMPNEKALLNDLAASSCVDGVCMVDPAFVKKLRRYSQTATQS